MKLSMTERETRLGWCFFLIYIFIIPIAVDFVGNALRLSLTGLNILFFLLNFACTAAIFYRFLWVSTKAAREKPLKTLRFTLTGLGVHFVCALLVSVLITPWIHPDFTNINDAAIIEMSKSHTAIFIFCTVVLVPITEELLFRGLVFGTIYKKSPRLALFVSVFIFASIHLLDYIGSADWRTLLVCFIQYVPAGLALAGSYAVSNNIVVPIFMHIATNAIAMATLR